MKMGIDEAHELYERIAENQSVWLVDRDTLKKSTSTYNVNAIIALAAQMELITVKLDNMVK